MDPKLKLKPTELIDIGIDKYTKIPVPILTTNMVSTIDIENGVPTDSFIFTYNANYSLNFSATINLNYPLTLSIDYGDGFTENRMMLSGGTTIGRNYTSAHTYTITVTGWLDKVIGIISNNGAITSASLTYVKKLVNLDLSNNRLTNLDLYGLVYLNTMILDNNYFPNDVIDDLYIVADTFLTFNGLISSTGTNNGKPSIYSESARNSLSSAYKGWELIYN